MWKIKRSYLDNVGHTESFYSDIEFDYYPNYEKSTDCPNTLQKLANGGGKSTNIALLLSVLNPDRRSFTQRVANNNSQNYGFDSYIHNDLGIIMLEMISDKGEIIILGLASQKRNDEEADRFSFSIQSGSDMVGDIFDHIPTYSRAINNASLREHVSSLSAFRKFLRSENDRNQCQITIEESHTNWRNHLYDLEFPLEIVNQMVAINSQEGGMANIMEFNNEFDFLAKFFNMVNEQTFIGELRNICDQEIAHAEEFRAIENKTEVFKKLDIAFSSFSEDGKVLNDAKSQENNSQDRIRVGLRDLKHTKNHQDKTISDLQNSVNEERTYLTQSVEEIKKHSDIANAMRFYEAEYNLSEAQHNHQENSKNLQKTDIDIKLNRAALLQADRSTLESRSEQLDHEISVYESESIKPLRDIYTKQAGISLYINNKSIVKSRTEQDKLNAEAKEKQDSIASNEETRTNLLEEKGGLHQSLISDNKIRDRVNAIKKDLLERGILLDHEKPEEAKTRHKEIVSKTCSLIEETKNQLVQIRESGKANQIAYSKKDGDIKDAKLHLDRLKSEQEEFVSTQSNIKTLILSEDISDAYRPEYAEGYEIDSRFKDNISESITRVRADQKFCQEKLAEHKNEHKQLKNNGHQLVSSTSRDACNLLISNGISRNDIYPYPEYLAALFDDNSDRIAEVIDSNPGRYLGLVTTNAAAFAQAKEIIQEISSDWKHAPVPVYMVSDDDILPSDKESDLAVLSNEDKIGYSKSTLESRLEEIQLEIASAEEDLDEKNIQCRLLDQLLLSWQGFYDRFCVNLNDRLKNITTTEKSIDKLAIELEEIASEAKVIIEKESKLNEEQAAHQDKSFTQAENLATITRYCDEHFPDLRKANQSIKTTEENSKAVLHKIKRTETKLSSLNTDLKKIMDNLESITSFLKLLTTNIGHTCYRGIKSVEPRSSLPPDDAHKMALQRYTEMNTAQNKPEVQHLKDEKKKIEKEVFDIVSELSAMPYYSQYEEAIKVESMNPRSDIHKKHESLQDYKNALIEKSASLQAQLDECESRMNEKRMRHGDKPSIPACETINETLALASEAEATCNDLRVKQSTSKDRLDSFESKIVIENKTLAIIESIIDLAISHCGEMAGGAAKLISSLSDEKEAISQAISESNRLKREYEDLHQKANRSFNRFRTIVVDEDRKNGDEVDNQIKQLLAIQTIDDALGNLENLQFAIKNEYEARIGKEEEMNQRLTMTTIRLAKHLRTSLKIFKQAVSTRIPEDCPVMTDMKIIKTSSALNRQVLDDETMQEAAGRCLRKWIDDQKIPLQSGGDALTASLLQSLFREGDLNIKLLKANTHRPTYMSISSIEGSGGQTLTTAFLLYVTIVNAHAHRLGKPAGGFLIADNPIGKANEFSLMKVQTEMAKFFSIQLIYFTGLKDLNAESMFENTILVNKSRRTKDRDLITIESSVNDTVFSAQLTQNDEAFAS